MFAHVSVLHRDDRSPRYKSDQMARFQKTHSDELKAAVIDRRRKHGTSYRELTAMVERGHLHSEIPAASIHEATVGEWCRTAERMVTSDQADELTGSEVARLGLRLAKREILAMEKEAELRAGQRTPVDPSRLARLLDCVAKANRIIRGPSSEDEPSDSADTPAQPQSDEDQLLAMLREREDVDAEPSEQADTSVPKSTNVGDPSRQLAVHTNVEREGIPSERSEAPA